jgi:transcriptional regulator with XRE-family HTH domain
MSYKPLQEPDPDEMVRRLEFLLGETNLSMSKFCERNGLRSGLLSDRLKALRKSGSLPDIREVRLFANAFAKELNLNATETLDWLEGERSELSVPERVITYPKVAGEADTRPNDGNGRSSHTLRHLQVYDPRRPGSGRDRKYGHKRVKANLEREEAVA